MSYAKILRDANFDAWESVQRALDSLPDALSERAHWLVRHISETKREYWRHINEALHRQAPPESDLGLFMAWEVEQAETLTATEWTRQLEYGVRTMTVADMLSLNARHSVWHAGQLMALVKSSSAPPQSHR